MSIIELINWGELSRMLTGYRMNIRKNRIPLKYKDSVDSLIKHLENWEAENQNCFEKTEAGGQTKKR